MKNNRGRLLKPALFLCTVSHSTACAVCGGDAGSNAAASAPVGDHFKPVWLHALHKVIANAIGHGLVENALIAECCGRKLKDAMVQQYVGLFQRKLRRVNVE